MKFKVDEIYTLKFASGEEYVVKIVDDRETTVTVAKPATVVPTHDGGMQLLPAIMTADHDCDVVIQKSQIVLAVPTKSQTADGYRSAISGIELPNKSIIMG